MELCYPIWGKHGDWLGHALHPLLAVDSLRDTVSLRPFEQFPLSAPGTYSDPVVAQEIVLDAPSSSNPRYTYCGFRDNREGMDELDGARRRTVEALADIMYHDNDLYQHQWQHHPRRPKFPALM